MIDWVLFMEEKLLPSMDYGQKGLGPERMMALSYLQFLKHNKTITKSYYSMTKIISEQIENYDIWTKMYRAVVY